jgi:ketosteroid isomerase-like protein
VYSCIAKIDVSKPGSQEKTVRYARVLLVMEKNEAGQWRIHRDIDNDTPEKLETE